MEVVTEVDKAAYQAALADVYKDFAKQFGQKNIDAIVNYKP